MQGHAARERARPLTKRCHRCLPLPQITATCMRAHGEEQEAKEAQQPQQPQKQQEERRQEWKEEQQKEKE